MSTLPDEIERLAKEASEAKAKLDDYERQHGESWRRRNLWKLAESRLNELIADNAPEIAARLRREERLEEAVDVMLANEHCGGDGWWKGWGLLKAAREALEGSSK